MKTWLPFLLRLFQLTLLLCFLVKLNLFRKNFLVEVILSFLIAITNNKSVPKALLEQKEKFWEQKVVTFV